LFIFQQESTPVEASIKYAYQKDQKQFMLSI